jgi:hypothetical protein
MHDFTNNEFSQNIYRVENLIAAYESLIKQSVDDTEVANDVLRAAVVFLHSSLEEIIRNLYLYNLPNASAENLSKIPFATHESSHRPKSIQLGDLLEFKGQFVENVIQESINRYVDVLNINNATQLVECLKLANIPCEPLQQFFEPLNSLMQRRHQIVHQMDRSNELDPLAYPINIIDVEIVKSWKEAILGLASFLFAQFESK